MKLYQLQAKQPLPISKEIAWDFLIAPDPMGFKILSGADRALYAEQIDHYNVKPFPIMSSIWGTETTPVGAGEYFVDEQRFGPYTLWHHRHFINKIDGGAKIGGLIDYSIPLGNLGQLAPPILVRKKTEPNFPIRGTKLKTLFGKIKTYQRHTLFKLI